MNQTASITKILVVDDDVKACSNLKRILEIKKYEVATAFGGEEAITKIHDFDPHLVLLDILMPRLTGDELVKMVKAWKPELVIIMTTGIANTETKEDCIRNGAFAVLEKPINIDNLLATITEAQESLNKEAG